MQLGSDDEQHTVSVDPFGGRKLRTRQTIGGEREPEGGDQELLRDLKLKRNLEKFKGYKPGQENVMFVDTCEKVNDKIKHQTRVVVVTTEAIYNVEPGSFKVKRCAHPTHGSVASQGLVVTGEAADRSALGRRNFRVLPRRRLPVHAHSLRVQVRRALKTQNMRTPCSPGCGVCRSDYLFVAPRKSEMAMCQLKTALLPLCSDLDDRERSCLLVQVSRIR